MLIERRFYCLGCDYLSPQATTDNDVKCPQCGGWMEPGLYGQFDGKFERLYLPAIIPTHRLPLAIAETTEDRKPIEAEPPEVRRWDNSYEMFNQAGGPMYCA